MRKVQITLAALLVTILINGAIAIIINEMKEDKIDWSSVPMQTWRVLVPDSLIVQADSGLYLNFSHIIYKEEETVQYPSERDFLKRLKSKLGPQTRLAFPRVEYAPRTEGVISDRSQYVFGLGGWWSDTTWQRLDSNVVYIRSGGRPEYYAHFVLKHELGHWVHYQLMDSEQHKAFLAEFSDEQHLATFLGYELERFLRGEPTAIDSILKR